MIRIVVLGLQLEGLLASWVFRQHPHTEVWCIGRGPIGERTSVWIEHPWHSVSLGNLLRELDVPYSSYKPRNGIMLQGSIERYPDKLRAIGRETAGRIYLDWQHKAGVAPTLNGVLKRKSDRRVRCDIGALIDAVTHGHEKRTIVSDDWFLTPGAVRVGRRSLPYDFAVVTLPLWEARDRVWFAMPASRACDRHVAMLVPRGGQRFRRWDQVLTPYTPGDAIHRVDAHGHAYAAEASGALDLPGMLSDLNFLFPEGYDLRSIRSEQFGGLAPLNEPIRWPEQVAPLGRYSEWQPSIMLDHVVDRAYVLLRKWTR